MLDKFCKLLEKAEGCSEFAIVVFCDIRGFSEFSTVHESPDTAMFIKRFYLKLIKDYFPSAHFAKPTGDGLLLIFKYSEDSLKDISKTILASCFKCMGDFPNMFKDDSMINFQTPKLMGFGIARGPVCCLYSGKQIIDYSGRLLNLASRLTDFARPQGIIIDGNFLMDVVPEELRSRFKDHQVYIRNIAEDTPVLICYSTPETELPDYCLSPIKQYRWLKEIWEDSVKKLKKFSGTFRIKLSQKAISKTKISVVMRYPNPEVKGYTSTSPISKFTYNEDADGPHVLVNLEEAKRIIKEKNIKSNKIIKFEVQYAPKHTAKP